jgi:hypothetical protein
MSIRARLLTALAAGLAIGLTAAPGPAQSLDQATAVSGPTASGRPVSAQATSAPARADTCGAVAASGRCLAVPPPDRLMSDHGPAYDVQGNPVDRYGYVLAVPENRGIREVFVTFER